MCLVIQINKEINIRGIFVTLDIYSRALRLNVLGPTTSLSVHTSSLLKAVKIIPFAPSCAKREIN